MQTIMEVAQELCDAIKRYPSKIQVDIVYTVSQYTAVSRAIGRWLAVALLVRLPLVEYVSVSFFSRSD
jgi:hypothetical protein